MKQFFKLSEIQKMSAIQHCTSVIMEKLILEEIHLEPVNDDDFAMFDTLADAMSAIQKLPTNDDKIAYLMSQPVIIDTIRSIALTQATNCLYLEDDETPIYLSSLVEQEKLLLSAGEPSDTVALADVSDVEDMDDDEFFDLKTHTVNKKPYNLN